MVNFREGWGSGRVWQTFSTYEFTQSKIKCSATPPLFETNICFKIAFVIGITDCFAVPPFH